MLNSHFQEEAREVRGYTFRRALGTDYAWERLARARDRIAQTRRCLARAHERVNREFVLGAPRHRQVGGGPLPAQRSTGGLDAWLQLSDGTAEQDGEIEKAVREIVQLQMLLIEGLCRHFPAIAPAIRETAQHLLEDSSHLTRDDCCEMARDSHTVRLTERRN